MSVQQYLQRYAEPEVELAAGLPGGWQYAVAVPCLDELAGVPPLLASLAGAAAHGGGRSLVVLVINGRDDAGAPVHAGNDELLRELGGAGLRAHSEHLDLLVIDRASPGRRLPARQGVGLARKIGCDVVTALQASGQVASPWIWTTDGDVEVPCDYFTTVPESDAVAVNLPFVHVPVDSEPGAAVAIRLYDLSLRYYVAGLQYAGSPYAFHTIGSTMVVRGEAYARVRGFPRREAAEDFHLLCKLAKLGPVVSGEGQPLRVQGRASDRVPFGTGAAVSKLVAEADADATFLMYDPRCFEELRTWLRALQDFPAHRRADDFWTQVDADTGLDPELCRRIGAELKVAAALQQAAGASPSAGVVRRHLRTWFDALKTLRFIHALERDQWPKVPWREALREAPFMDLE
jgi:hypothetical protein